jgi:hypothetical protein
VRCSRQPAAGRCCSSPSGLAAQAAAPHYRTPWRDTPYEPRVAWRARLACSAAAGEAELSPPVEAAADAADARARAPDRVEQPPATLEATVGNCSGACACWITGRSGPGPASALHGLFTAVGAAPGKTQIILSEAPAEPVSSRTVLGTTLLPPWLCGLPPQRPQAPVGFREELTAAVAAALTATLDPLQQQLETMSQEAAESRAQVGLGAGNHGKRGLRVPRAWPAWAESGPLCPRGACPPAPPRCARVCRTQQHWLRCATSCCRRRGTSSGTL